MLGDANASSSTAAQNVFVAIISSYNLHVCLHHHPSCTYVSHYIFNVIKYHNIELACCVNTIHLPYTSHHLAKMHFERKI
jgi:hypothetical protein